MYFELGAPRLTLDDGCTERVWQFAEDGNGLVPMVREFRDSIREARAPELSGAVGLEALGVVLSVYESMEKGVSVMLPSSWSGGPPAWERRDDRRMPHMKHYLDGDHL
jgi:hypothetical protein